MQTFRIMNNKDRKINSYLKILAFVLSFVLLLEALSATVFSKKSAASYNNKLSSAYSFTNEPKNSIQIAGIGNSDLYSGFVPVTLWQEFGYTSTVVASPRQTPIQSYEMMTELMKNQHPDLLIIEVDMLYSSVPDNHSKVQSKNSFESFFDYMNTDNFQEIIEGHYSIFTFHDKWKKIGRKEKSTVTAPNSHGYKYSNAVKKIVVNNYMSDTDASENISDVNAQYLDKMISYCKNNEIEVLLVEIPSVNSWNSERHNAVKLIAEKYNINFVDLNMCYDDMKFNVSEDFRDKGNHLNYNGANKATKYLGEYIKNNYSIDDRRGDAAFNYWNESCKAFIDEIEQENKANIS